MEKKFLDKKGLAEFCKSFKDKFVSKADVPTKVSQLENDSKLQSQKDVEFTIGSNMIKQYAINRVPPNLPFLGLSYTEKLGELTESPCLVFTYGNRLPDGDPKKNHKLAGEVIQVAIDIVTRKAYTRASKRALIRNEGKLAYTNWDKWKEEVGVISEIPTKLSQLENDKNYVDINKVNELILQASGLKKEVHDSLPTQGKDNILYLVKDNKGKENNFYLEYLWIENKFELIGSTDVDLSQYVKKEDLSEYAKKTEIPKIDLSKLDLSQLDFSKLDEKYLQHKGELLSNIDLNTFKKCGIFLCYSQQTKNIPKEFDDSFYPLVLLNVGHVNNAGDLCFTQLVTTHVERNSVYIRFGIGTKFFEWKPLIQEQFTQKEKEKLKNLATSRSATFVIANYDSSDTSKAGADYVIQKNESPCDIINSFIGKLPAYGGRIQLTEGNFIEKNDKSINLNKNNVILEGYGKSTLLQRVIEEAGNNFIDIRSRISVKNMHIKDIQNTAISFDSDSSDCMLENVMSESKFAFDIYGKNHSLLNCVGISRTEASVAICVHDDNHKFINCTAIVEKKSTAFEITHVKNAEFIGCVGESKDDVVNYINGIPFNIIDSHNCKFSQCTGESRNMSAFVIYVSSYNTFVDCDGTITPTNQPVFSIGGGINSDKRIATGNILIGCRAVTKSKNEEAQFHIYENANQNIITSCVMQNTNVLNEGRNNVITNNMIMK